MEKKRLEHIIRPSTPEERARHKRIRELVEKEFPPAGGSRRVSEESCKAIKAAISASGRTVQQIADESGVPEQVLSGFLSGRVLRMVMAERLTKTLGLPDPAPVSN